MNPENIKEILFSFNGRISRKVYWLYCGLPSLVLGTWIAVANPDRNVIVVIFLLLAWPSLAMHIKRWHDQNKSGWWQLLAAIPLVGGLIVMGMCGFIKGTDGSNMFGTDPLEN